MCHWFIAILLFACPVFTKPEHKSRYALEDHYTGYDFLSAFEHQAIQDPTNGRVNYVSEQEALERGLTVPSPQNGGILLRSDAESVLDPSGPGRASVRLRSRKEYTTHVVVLDVMHVPVGCGTWPAFWETREYGWPEFGEVDIIEGVNSMAPNKVSLHTTSGCEMPQSRAMTGTTTSTNCDWQANYNQGCGVQFNDNPTRPSFGFMFNNQGGGVFAMERTDEHIRIWFWTRDEVRMGSVPSDLMAMGLEGSQIIANADDADAGRRINTDTWGIPVALFPNTRCNLKRKFGPNSIIINLTFCGDWAGNHDVYRSAGCPSTCVDFVNSQPRAFTDAYWDIKSLRIYAPLTKDQLEEESRLSQNDAIPVGIAQGVFSVSGTSAGNGNGNGTAGGSRGDAFKSTLKGVFGRFSGK